MQGAYKMKNYKSGRVVSLIFAAFFLFFALYATWDRAEFKSNSVVTQGKVVDIVTESTSKVDRVFVFITRDIEKSIIEYTDKNGDTYTKSEAPFLKKAPYAMNETVDIRYNPEFPESGIVDTFTNLFGFTLLFYFISFVFFFVFFYLKVMQKGKRK
jgi:hypothetical protein